MEATPKRPVYEAIGTGYARARRPDPRIARAINDALGDARRVVNVGAGTGNYEPTDRAVVAVDPADAMIRQRADVRIPAVRAVAEALPFGRGAFDAALATFTLHHWRDLGLGLREMRRVARRQVIVMNEPPIGHQFWLARYFAAALAMPTEANAPHVADIERHLDVRDVLPLLVPADCTDGFVGAYWCRPEAYFDPYVQRSMSFFALMPQAMRARGLRHLERDLANGTWDAHYGFLRDLPAYDIGYRLVIAGRNEPQGEEP